MMTREMQIVKQYNAEMKRKAAQNVQNWGELDKQVAARKAAKEENQNGTNRTET